MLGALSRLVERRRHMLVGFSAAGTLIAVCLVVVADPLPSISVVEFASPRTFRAAAAPPIILADFNEDGHVDVAVTRRSTDSVAVLLGDGRGELRVPVVSAAGAGPRAVVAPG